MFVQYVESSSKSIKKDMTPVAIAIIGSKDLFTLHRPVTKPYLQLCYTNINAENINKKAYCIIVFFIIVG